MEATLLTLGVILIVVGLIGQVKAQEIEIGTKNPLVRLILGLVGIGFVLIALSKSINIPGLTPTESPTPAMQSTTIVPPTNASLSPTLTSLPPTPTTITPSTDTPLPPTLTPLPPTPAIVPEDCLTYNPANLQIVDEGASGWLLTDNVSRMLVLDNEADAKDALALAQRHTAHCFIGRDNTRSNRRDYIVEYWRGDSGRATTIVQRDCIPYNTAGLQIVDEGVDGWLLTDGASRMLILDNQRDAENALILAKRYTNLCFIGRGNTRPDRSEYIVGYWE